jgi:fumarate reductase subunit D
MVAGCVAIDGHHLSFHLFSMCSQIIIKFIILVTIVKQQGQIDREKITFCAGGEK